VTESRRKAVIFAITIATIIWGAWNLWPRAETSRNNTEIAAGFGLADTTNSHGTRTLRSGTPAALPEWENDPFVRIRPHKTATVPRPADLKLSVVSRSGDKPMAVINGEVLAVGSTILGWTIIDMNESSVKLKKGTRTQELKIRGG
jgi:hypothetical protein